MNAHTRIDAHTSTAIGVIMSGKKAAPVAATPAVNVREILSAAAGAMADTARKHGLAAKEAGAAIVAAGGATDENKATFYVGYIMKALNLRSAERVGELLAFAGHGKTPSKKQKGARSEEQERAYTAARVAYLRACDVAGLRKKPEPKASTENQTDTKGDEQGNTDAQGDAGAGTAPDVWDGDRVNDAIRHAATTLLQMINKRKVAGKHPILEAAVVEFHKRVAGADAELEALHK